MLINSMSQKITNLIKNNSNNITTEKEEIIRYGAEILIYEIILTTITFSLALILGIFKYSLAYFIAYGTLRASTGGAHAKTRVICAISYLVFMFSIIFLSMYMWADSYYPSIAILILEIIIIYKYAPGDTIEKPIISKRIIRNLRTSSFITVVIIFIAAIIIWHFDKVFYNIIILATLYVIFLLTPIGYKLQKCKKSNEAWKNEMLYSERVEQ